MGKQIEKSALARRHFGLLFVLLLTFITTAEAATLRNNTLISDTLPGGWFLRVHEDKFPNPVRLDIGNNETKGIGILSPVLQ